MRRGSGRSGVKMLPHGSPPPEPRGDAYASPSTWQGAGGACDAVLHRTWRRRLRPICSARAWARTTRASRRSGRWTRRPRRSGLAGPWPRKTACARTWSRCSATSIGSWPNWPLPPELRPASYDFAEDRVDWLGAETDALAPDRRPAARVHPARRIDAGSGARRGEHRDPPRRATGRGARPMPVTR